MKGIGHLGTCAVGALLSTQALASENGNQHYPIGVNTVANGNLPPPGMLILYNYSTVSWNDSLADNSGGKAIPDFSLHTQADAPRFLYTWKNLEIGPFHYTTGLITPIVHARLNVEGTRGSSTRLGDITLENYLGYASPDHKLFYYFGFETYIPTGHYNKNNLVNIGSNYWTFAPNVDVTYNPSPKLELTATIIAEFNTTNKATHYHSGNDIDLDYGVSYRPFNKLPDFGLGVQGYFYKQISDDKVAGARAAPDGNRGQEFGIGPQIRYDWPFGGIAVKFQHEYAVRNRPRGDRLWVEFAVPLFGRPRHDQ